MQVNGPEKSQGGLGVGLAIARRLWSCTAARLMSTRAGPDAAQSSSSGCRSSLLRARLAPSRASARLKVFVVDDNSDLVDMLDVAIRGMGHDVQTALDGQTAISATLSYRPDVVLLDLGLPVVSGLDVARQLRRSDSVSLAL